ncbi:MAG: hypothetical protein RL033_3030, partial [Pseudomonadota bacterium]
MPQSAIPHAAEADCSLSRGKSAQMSHLASVTEVTLSERGA